MPRHSTRARNTLRPNQALGPPSHSNINLTALPRCLPRNPPNRLLLSPRSECLAGSLFRCFQLAAVGLARMLPEPPNGCPRPDGCLCGRAELVQATRADRGDCCFRAGRGLAASAQGRSRSTGSVSPDGLARTTHRATFRSPPTKLRARQSGRRRRSGRAALHMRLNDSAYRRARPGFARSASCPRAGRTAARCHTP